MFWLTTHIQIDGSEALEQTQTALVQVGILQHGCSLVSDIDNCTVLHVMGDECLPPVVSYCSLSCQAFADYLMCLQLEVNTLAASQTGNKEGTGKASQPVRKPAKKIDRMKASRRQCSDWQLHIDAVLLELYCCAYAWGSVCVLFVLNGSGAKLKGTSSMQWAQIICRWNMSIFLLQEQTVKLANSGRPIQQPRRYQDWYVKQLTTCCSYGTVVTSRH